MSELKFYFLSTGERPSMLVEHPEQTVLFDVPGVDLPSEPNAIFLTDRDEGVVKKAQEFAEPFNIPVMGAGKLSADGFEIEPFQAAKKVKGKGVCKAYGYMIKSGTVNIGYVPYASDFPRELYGADVVILSGDNSNHTVAMAKSAGIARIFLTGLSDEMRKSAFPLGVTKLVDGQTLSLIEKHAEIRKDDATYRESQGEQEGTCESCRFTFSKAEWSTAYKNRLPDSSFAYIEPGGKKDSEGKTTPRSLRHLPYKDENGKVDIPHLRNARARAAQQPYGPKAMPKLNAAAKAAGVGEFQKPVDVKPNEIRVRVHSVGDFQADSFRTISISAGKGIRAVVGRPKGQETTRVQSYRFDKDQWDAQSAAAWVESHGESPKSSFCKKVSGGVYSDCTCDLWEPQTLAPLSEFSKATQQAFGSPGGKRALAKEIVKRMPEHATYVEPYAGGAAVFFAKERVGTEVINDLDVDIAQAYKDLQGISDAEVRKLQRSDWTISKARFNRLKKSTATGKTGRLYRFLYMRGSAYGNYTQPSASHEGKVMKVASRLPQLRERLEDVTIANSDALEIIHKFDGPETFFYLDPPYPTEWKWDEGGHGGRAGSDKWSGKDLHRLIETLKSIKGKFLLSLEGEVSKLIPKEFTVTKVDVPRQMALGPTGKLGQDPEILVSNYDMSVEKSQPGMTDVHTDKPLRTVKTERGDEEELIVIAKSEEQRLVWTVNMIPNAVDGEGHWQTPEEIMKVAHNFMLKDVPIWSEHKKSAPGVFPVQSFTLPFDWNFTDFQGNERSLAEGTWITVLWVQNDEEWEKVKSGVYAGTSVRGFARKAPGSPPPDERKEVGE